jgi:alkylhydroperoxidase/carboxymuconolactone decarboxylase family protein YurZ
VPAHPCQALAPDAASDLQLYAPGTQRHIAGALKAGASFEEVMEVLKLCFSFGVESLLLGVPILAEEVPNG